MNDHIKALEKALYHLVTAGANRDFTQGDPIRLIEVQAELRRAVRKGRALLEGVTHVYQVETERDFVDGQ